VAELRDLASGRSDLLAEEAGLLIGFVIFLGKDPAPVGRPGKNRAGPLRLDCQDRCNTAPAL
jgi:hypothetical protein